MKRVFKLGILLGFIFSLCTAAQAAPTACKINGVVTDSISGEAIPFVTIGIENNEGKVLSRIASDALGKFTITASSGQNYRLVVSSVGYGTKYVDISLSENEKNKDLLCDLLCDSWRFFLNFVTNCCLPLCEVVS